MYSCVCVCACEYGCPERPEEDVGSPGAVVTGSFELLGAKLGSFARAVCPDHWSMSVVPVTFLLPQMHSLLHSETQCCRLKASLSLTVLRSSPLGSVVWRWSPREVTGHEGQASVRHGPPAELGWLLGFQDHIGSMVCTYGTVFAQPEPTPGSSRTLGSKECVLGS